VIKLSKLSDEVKGCIVEDDSIGGIIMQAIDGV
jgi:hypothetical protein